MPKKLTPTQKADALEILAANGGDIAQTHLQTGIAERTLYHWRSELWRTWRRQTPEPPSPKPLPQFADDLDALAFLRHKIMRELLNIANNYPEGVAYTTPIQRTAQFTQLMSRLLELDEHLKPYKPAETEVQRLIMAWDAGLYLRTDRGYRGPYTPAELHRDWKVKYGPTTRLEFYWGDNTFTILPDEGELLERLLDTKDFQADPCPLVNNDDDPDDFYEDRRYGWREG